MNSIHKNTMSAPLRHHHDEHCGCGQIHHDHHHKGEHCSCGHDHDHHSESHHLDAFEQTDTCGCSCDAHDEHNHCCDEDSSEDDGESHSYPHELSGNTKVYTLENLGCAHCAAKMEEKISALDGINAASITFATKQLRITAENPDDYLDRVQKICASIESQVIVRKSDDKQRSAPQSAVQKKRKISEEKADLIVILAGALFFGLSIGANALNFPNSDMAVLLFSAIAYVILGGKVLLEAARNIRNGQVFDENFLMGIATIGAFCIAEYLEAVGVMLFYRIGEYFEHRAVGRSRSQIMDAVDMRPETVNLITGDNGESREIPAQDAKPGDLILIRPGDRIPLDGVITEGTSRIDTSPITGEPVPVSAASGDAVTSGCINTSGRLIVRVEKPLSESMVSRILDSVENAAASKPKIDRFITRFSRVYTPCVVLAAAAVALIPSLVSGNWDYWIYTALTFLVMSCPCALVLSVPLAFFSGIGAGSKRGILFKGGLSMEALGKVKTVIMDKTGTITEGNFLLQQIIPAQGFTEEQVLTLAAACEQSSTHPIAASIVKAAGVRNLVPAEAADLEELPGFGIKAKTNEKTILCGNEKLMQRFGVTVPEQAKQGFGAEVYLAADGAFAGRLIISDTIKADAKTAVTKLKTLGLHTVMLTGDSAENAESVALETGINETHTKLLPEDKLNLLSHIREKRGAVMFVGDGINDAPVLAGADVGAAMGSGADAAIEVADAVFMNGSVSSIADAVTIARKTGKIAMENVIFALIIKALVMVLGLFGFANMWLAVFADSGVAMLCVLNAIRLLYRK